MKIKKKLLSLSLNRNVYFKQSMNHVYLQSPLDFCVVVEQRILQAAVDYKHVHVCGSCTLPTVCLTSGSLAEICLLSLEVSSVLDMCCQKPAIVSHQS